MLNKKIRGYSSLISAILINLLNGNLTTFPNLIPYYQSYLYYKHNNTEKISEMQLYFVEPIGIVFQIFLPMFMNYIDKILTIKILTIFSAVLLFFSRVIIYFSTEYYLLLISYAIYGVGISCSYFPSTKNCWKFFPEKKDIMSGIIFSSFGLGSFVFTSIADQIIDPDNEKKEGKYYSKEVAYNFLTFVKFEIFSIAILGIIASLLSFPYEDEKKEDENENKNKNEEINKKGENIPLKKMILSLEFVKCFAITGCTQIFGYLLSNTYRNF